MADYLFWNTMEELFFPENALTKICQKVRLRSLKPCQKNMEYSGQNNGNEQNIKELEIEYIQAISDSDSMTMTASVRNSETTP